MSWILAGMGHPSTQATCCLWHPLHFESILESLLKDCHSCLDGRIFVLCRMSALKQKKIGFSKPKWKISWNSQRFPVALSFLSLYSTKPSFLFEVSMSQVSELLCCHTLKCVLARRKFSTALSSYLISIALFTGILIYLQLRFRSFTTSGPLVYSLFFWKRKDISVSQKMCNWGKQTPNLIQKVCFLDEIQTLMN